MKSCLARIRPTIAGLLLSLPAMAIAADSVTAQSYSQSATRLAAPHGRVVVIDPFVRDTPVTPDRERDLERPGNVDPILVPHAHGDRFGNTGVELARVAPGDRRRFE